MLKSIAENRDPHSLAAKLRQKRFRFFLRLIRSLPKPIRILDVGGTQKYWEVASDGGAGFEVMLLNLRKEPVSLRNFSSVAGDAKNLELFADKQFDIVFSNSVIEHLGTWQDQLRMAREVQRVGKRYFVQTPNYWFPVEPHFLFPGFQFLPIETRVWLVRHFSVGWYPRIPDLARAREEVSAIRLLSRRELKELFPGARIFTERFAGLSKSLTAYGGF